MEPGGGPLVIQPRHLNRFERIPWSAKERSIRAAIFSSPSALDLSKSCDLGTKFNILDQLDITVGVTLAKLLNEPKVIKPDAWAGR